MGRPGNLSTNRTAGCPSESLPDTPTLGDNAPVADAIQIRLVELAHFEDDPARLLNRKGYEAFYSPNEVSRNESGNAPDQESALQLGCPDLANRPIADPSPIDVPLHETQWVSALPPVPSSLRAVIWIVALLFLLVAAEMNGYSALVGSEFE